MEVAVLGFPSLSVTPYAFCERKAPSKKNEEVGIPVCPVTALIQSASDSRSPLSSQPMRVGRRCPVTALMQSASVSRSPQFSYSPDAVNQ